MSAAGGKLRWSPSLLCAAGNFSGGLVALGLVLVGAAAAQGVSGPRATEPSLGVAPRVDTSGDPLPDYAVARLGTNRFRHPGHIRGVALSRDESFVITVGDGTSIRLWELPSGKLSKSIEVPARWRNIEHVALSPDNKLIAVVSFIRNSEVAVFDIETGKELWRDSAIDRYEEQVNQLAFSSDGSVLVLVGERHVFDWQAANGEGRREREGFPSLAYDPASNTFYSFEKDSKDVWKESLSSGARQKAWTSPKDDMSAGELTISSTGRWALHNRYRHATLENRESRRFVFVIDLTNGSVVHSWEYEVRSSAYHRLLGSHQPLLIRSIVGKTEFHVLGRESSLDVPAYELQDPRIPGFRHLSAIAQKRRLLIGTNYRKVLLYDFTKGKSVPSFSHPDSIHDASFSPDGQWIATMEYGGAFRVWNGRTGEQTWEKSDESVSFFGFSSDSKYAILAGKDALYRHDLRTGELKSTVVLDKVLPRLVTERGPFAYSSRREVYACANGDPLLLVDAKTGKQIGEGNWNRDKLKLSQFSPSGNYLLTVSEDVYKTPTILLYDLRRAESPKRLNCPGQWVVAVAFDPSDGYVALLVQDTQGRSRRVLHIVEVATGEVVRKRLPEAKESNCLKAVGFLDGHTLALSFGDIDGVTGDTKSESVVIEDVHGDHPRPWRIPGFRFLDVDARLLLTNDRVSGRVPEVISFDHAGPLGEAAHKDLPEAQLAALWDQLAKDPVSAEDAVRGMREVEPRKLATFLKSRVLPIPAHDPAAIRKAVAEMAAVDQTEAVEDARRRVMAMGVQALPAIRQVLREEIHYSTELLLREMRRTIAERAWNDPEEVRVLRALRALGGNWSGEARELLLQIADGAEDARRTFAAKEILRLHSLPAHAN